MRCRPMTFWAVALLPASSAPSARPTHVLLGNTPALFILKNMNLLSHFPRGRSGSLLTGVPEKMQFPAVAKSEC